MELFFILKLELSNSKFLKNCLRNTPKKACLISYFKHQFVIPVKTGIQIKSELWEAVS